MKFKKILLCVALSSLLLVTGCSKIAKLDNGKDMVMEIDGKQFSVDDFYNELKDQAGFNILIDMVGKFIIDKEYPTTDEIEKYADDIIASMKSQYGDEWESTLQSQGYTEEKLRDEYIFSYKQNDLVLDYAKTIVTEKQIQEYYDKYITKRLTVKHILIEPDVASSASNEEKDKAEAAALEKAKEVIKKLDEGAKFDDLVQEYSDDKGSLADNGTIADFQKNDVVEEFWNASLELEKDKYSSEPVKSQYGYHVILKIEEKDKQTLDEVKEEVTETIAESEAQADQNIYYKAFDWLSKKYNMKIHDTGLDSNYTRIINSILEKEE